METNEINQYLVELGIYTINGSIVKTQEAVVEARTIEEAKIEAECLVEKMEEVYQCVMVEDIGEISRSRS